MYYARQSIRRLLCLARQVVMFRGAKLNDFPYTCSTCVGVPQGDAGGLARGDRDARHAAVAAGRLHAAQPQPRAAQGGQLACIASYIIIKC